MPIRRYEAICAIDDVDKLFRLERYMREEGFGHTAAAARERLIALRELPTPEEEEELRRVEEREEKNASDDVQGWLQSMKKDRSGAQASRREPDVHGRASGPPVRGKATAVLPEPPALPRDDEGQPAAVEAREDQHKEQKKKVGDLRSGAAYYKEWDRIAADLENEDGEHDSSSKATSSSQSAMAGGKNDGGEEDPARDETDDEWAARRLGVLLTGSETASERAWLAEREKEKGNEHFRAREFRAAVDAYSTAIAIDGSSAFYYSNRANAYAKLKRFAESERDCSAALQKRPSLGKALFRRATARLELGKHQEAFDDASAALEIDGGTSKELVALHKRAFEKLREDDARKKAADGTKTSVEDDNAHKRRDAEPARRMVIEEVNGTADHSECDTIFTASDVFAGPRPGYVFKAGDRGLGYYADAQGLALSSSRDDVSDDTNDCATSEDCEQRATAVKAAADRLYRDAEYERATGKYTEAIDIVARLEQASDRSYHRRGVGDRPSLSPRALLLRTLYMNRATCHMKCLQATQAEADSCRAIEYDPEYAKAYHRRASARRHLGKLGAAHEDYMLVLKSYPSNEALAKEIASLEEEMRNARLERTDAGRADDLKRAGNDVYREGKFAEAAALYEQSLSVLKSAVVFSNLAQCRLKMKDHAGAEDAASCAIQINPELVKAFYRRSIARRALNKLSEALEDLSFVLGAQGADNVGVRKEHDELSRLLHDTLSKARTTVAIEEEDSDDDNDVGDDAGGIGHNSTNAGHDSDTAALKHGSRNAARTRLAGDSTTDSLTRSIEHAATRAASTEVKVSAAMSMMARKTVDRHFPPPKSHMDFERAVRSLSAKKEAAAAYLLSIDPASFPSIFKEDISPESISTVVRIVRDSVARADPAAALEILAGLTHVKRFAVITMLTPKSSRADVATVFDVLDEAAPEERERVAALRAQFKCA